ncbi:MAG: hypothetical protein SGJ19_07535 [Planctomycetia bacterium]|nr:hypothetical protein [Planctomycetia bacterium]
MATVGWGFAWFGATLMAMNLADAVAPELGNLTASAVLGWYAWYTATRTTPGMLRSFREEMNAARQDFRSETAAQRDQLACEREYRHRDSAAIARALQRLAKATARTAEDSPRRHGEGRGSDKCGVRSDA